MKKKLKVMAAAMLASALPLSGCDIMGIKIPGSDLVMDLVDKIFPGKEKTVEVTSVTLSSTSLSLKVNETATLTATVAPENATDKTVTWESTDTTVATVVNGTVKGLKAGSATIKATAGGKTDQCTVTVTENSSSDDEDEKKVTNVTVTGTNTVKVGKTVKLTARVSGDEGVNTEVTWSSENEAVATVAADGTVTGVSAGTAKIVATSKADPTKSGHLEVTVEEVGWDAATKAMMQQYLGVLVPYFEGSFTWTDEYWGKYKCLTAESSVSADLDKAVTAFTEAHWEIEEDEAEVYAILEVGDMQYLADIYEYQGVVSVDVYAYEIIREWPTEDIAAGLEEAGFDVELPVFTAQEAVRYQFEADYDEEYEEWYVYVICQPEAEDSELSHLDYLALFDDTFTKTEDEYGDYMVVPADKSCMIYVVSLIDSEYNIIPGFEIVVTPYVEDYTIKASVESEFVVTGATTTVTVEKIGADIPAEAVIAFSSDNEAVATVNAEGVVTAVAEGKAVVTAEYEGYTSSVTLYVKDSVRTEFSEAEISVFKQIHDVDGIVIPFNAHFNSVSYDLEEEFVTVTGDEVGAESAINYREALIEDGWVDLLEEQGVYEFYFELFTAFGMEGTIEDVVGMMVFDGITFEKEIKVDDTHSYWVDAVLYLDAEDEEATEGALTVEIFDIYFYSYADAKTAAEGMLAAYEVESTATLPETAIPGSHYYVENNEEDGYVGLAAYDTTATLAQLKEALEASGFILEEANDEGTTYLVGTSTDGLLDVEALIYQGDAEIMVGPHVGEEAEGVTIDFAEVTATAGTIGAFSFDTAKAGGQSAPAYNATKEELRLYANNTITFTSEETMTSIFFDANTCGESKATGSIVSASVGTVSAVEGGFLWEGEANEVTLTASASGQVHINSIDINGGGEGGGGGQTSDLAAFADQVSEDLFGETGVLEYDEDYDEYWCAYYSEQSTAMAACEEIAEVLSQYYYEYQAPTAQTDPTEGDYVDAAYGEGEFIIYVMTYEVTGGIVFQIEVYVGE